MTTLANVSVKNVVANFKSMIDANEIVESGSYWWDDMKDGLYYDICFDVEDDGNIIVRELLVGDEEESYDYVELHDEIEKAIEDAYSLVEMGYEC